MLLPLLPHHQTKSDQTNKVIHRNLANVIKKQCDTDTHYIRTFMELQNKEDQMKLVKQM